VFGGTPAGVSAAVQAARMGKTVILVEPGRHVGGMMGSGLGTTDYGGPIVFIASVLFIVSVAFAVSIVFIVSIAFFVLIVFDLENSMFLSPCQYSRRKSQAFPVYSSVPFIV
jgi:hypothetical protein